jgi:hypothetical protein
VSTAGELVNEAARPTDAAADAELRRLMTEISERVLTGDESASAVASYAVWLFTRPWGYAADYAGEAYVLWAMMTDLVDDQTVYGPGSESLCERYARAAAADWVSIDPSNDAAVDAYFERWRSTDSEGWKSQGGQ